MSLEPLRLAGRNSVPQTQKHDLIHWGSPVLSCHLRVISKGWVDHQLVIQFSDASLLNHTTDILPISRHSHGQRIIHGRTFAKIGIFFPKIKLNSGHIFKKTKNEAIMYSFWNKVFFFNAACVISWCQAPVILCTAERRLIEEPASLGDQVCCIHMCWQEENTEGTEGLAWCCSSTVFTCWNRGDIAKIPNVVRLCASQDWVDINTNPLASKPIAYTVFISNIYI